MAETTQAKPSRWAGAVKKTKKILRWILTPSYSFHCYFYILQVFLYLQRRLSGWTYLQKFSKKGVIFKTYEGEMILSSVSSTANVTLASDKFIFSVTQKGFVSIQFDTLQGRNVIVHYKEKKGSCTLAGRFKISCRQYCNTKITYLLKGPVQAALK